MGPHPYESIPLDLAGYALAGYLLVAHGLMWWKAEACKQWLIRLPRHRMAGVNTLAVGTGWLWLLIATLLAAAPRAQGLYGFSQVVNSSRSNPNSRSLF